MFVCVLLVTWLLGFVSNFLLRRIPEFYGKENVMNVTVRIIMIYVELLYPEMS